MRYLDIAFCNETVFPFIHTFLCESESAPDYEEDEYGIGELKKVLEFVKNDDYYPSFWDKCAYLICSIAGSQYFKNGNKRLGVSILIAFLVENQATVIRFSDKESYKNFLLGMFPDSQWEENENIGSSDALFLYNLALAIATNTFYDFSALKTRVSDLLQTFCKLH